MPRRLTLLVALLAGCSSARTTPARSFPRAPPRLELDAGDLLFVAVRDEPSLSGEQRIPPDGTLRLRPCGDARVTALDADALSRKLEGCLRGGYLIDPHVRVTVLEHTRRATVLGQVTHPGRVALERGLTLARAIAASGGFTVAAHRRAVTIQRKLDDHTARFSVDVDAILNGEAEDVPLDPGDVVFVSERVF